MVKGQAIDQTKCKRNSVKIFLDKSQGTRHRDLYISSCQITRSNIIDWVTQARTVFKTVCQYWMSSHAAITVVYPHLPFTSPASFKKLAKPLAPQPGIEPGTNWLTANCSTAELSGNRIYTFFRYSRPTLPS